MLTLERRKFYSSVIIFYLKLLNLFIKLIFVQFIFHLFAEEISGHICI